MDQGDAVVWAAALGIAGTLVGALGGALVQGRIARRQVRDQEAVDVRHRLREERQVAFAAVLDRCGEVEEALGVIIEARARPDWQEDADHRELWAPANAALRDLQRAVTAVQLTGPDRMAQLAGEVREAMLAKADLWRTPGLGVVERGRLSAEHGRGLEQAQHVFIRGARVVLDTPGGSSTPP